MTTMPRYYTKIEPVAADGDHQERMRRVVDALWEALCGQDVSWVGFYLPDPENPDHLVLGPSRDKPACSPISMQGVCGRAFRERRPLVVRDVKNLGAEYIACDPRDRSEIVIPCLEHDGRCWGVLDLDSFELGAFDESDAENLRRILIDAGLTDPRHSGGPPMIV